MKFVKVVVTKKDGTVTEAEYAKPENLKELLTIYPEQRVYELGLAEYVMKTKRKLKSGYSHVIKIRVDKLDIDVQQALRKLGLIKD